MAGTDKPDADAEQMLRVQQGDLEAERLSIVQAAVFNLICEYGDPDRRRITQKVFVQAYKASSVIAYRPVFHLDLYYRPQPLPQ